MKGLSISLMRLDDELKACLDLEADCWGFNPWGGTFS
jgi:dihydroxyacetone kinase